MENNDIYISWKAYAIYKLRLKYNLKGNELSDWLIAELWNKLEKK